MDILLEKYVTRLVESITKRKWEHENCPSPTSLIDQRLQEYGTEAFSFEVIEECEPDVLDEREIYWIKFYNSYNNGYNQTLGGQSQFGENNLLAKLNEKQVKEIIECHSPYSAFAGEHNPTSVLTEEKAKEIIELLKTDKRSIAQLSRDLNISINILYDINRCRTWKYLHNFNKNIRNEYKQGGWFN